MMTPITRIGLAEFVSIVRLSALRMRILTVTSIRSYLICLKKELQHIFRCFGNLLTSQRATERRLTEASRQLQQPQNPMRMSFTHLESEYKVE